MSISHEVKAAVDVHFTIPEIESERLTLRAIAETDLDDLMELWGDEETAKYIGGVQTRVSSWHSIASLFGHWYWRGFGLWAVVEKESGKVIGWTGIWFPEGWLEPELIWSLNKHFHGKGYATEAAETARNYAYQQLKLKTLISVIAPENTASIKVAERLGASYEKDWELRGNKVNIWRHPGVDK